jgi:hypothetical protein
MFKLFLFDEIGLCVVRLGKGRLDLIALHIAERHGIRIFWLFLKMSGLAGCASPDEGKCAIIEAITTLEAYK